ncbi:iron complex outermembrane recepter protein [Tenacibaculum sp. MAR_2009_124]|uniref:TonB-dependent receptor n=1 Tax=Tenacibaculum sp. MAR_2009_124 TaxID=1250059 RepID=UPI000897FC71|nr:TonB-dependent receptor [Tenacibaculum sp. MAR_2009_124]SEB36405.1 iron complex outermembrane recepter protein [Tenacibaculum sp. MAR_2009_124]
MKIKFSLLLLLCTIVQVFSQASLEGTVKNVNNETIPFASVFLKKKQLGTSCDENGSYTITNIPLGTYTVIASAVGYHKTVLQIEIKEGANTANFTIKPNTQLDEVELFGSRNKRAEKLETLTRLPLAPNEQLQSISVLSHKLIDQQNALSISDVTKNVAGVYTFSTYGNVRESMSLRGYRGVPILKNGVRINSDFRGIGVLTDMSGVDNIQVLKGISAISQGLGADIGSAGGVINIVTKTPKFYDGGEVTFRTGSFGKVRPTFDFYGAINEEKTLAFRVAGAYDRADSYRTHVNSERFYINPSLAWRPDDKTTVVLEMDYMDDSRTPDQGTINLGTYDVNNILKLQDNKFVGFDTDRANTLNTTYAIRLDRKISDKLTVKAGLFSSNLETYTEASYIFQGGGRTQLPILGSTQRYREYYASGRADKNSVFQIDLVGKNVQTGSIKHTFQVGVDYRTTDFTNTPYTTAFPDETLPYVDIIEVNQSINNTLPGSVSVTKGTSTTGSTTKSYGFTIQDKISFNDWADVFLGIRYTSLERTKGNFLGRSLTGAKRDDAVNPLVGFNLKPTENVIVFGSYASSSNPMTSFYRDINGNELGTERWDQIETGIKSTWLNNSLRFNITAFYTSSKNLNLQALDTNGTFLGYYIKGGEDTRNGIEVELIGRLLPNLEVIGGYSYLNAKYKDHASYYYNSSPLNTPKHTANFWARYNFENYLEGLSLAAGAYYLGERPHNVWSRNYTHTGVEPGVKPFDLKAYTTVNLQASYKFNKNFSIDVFGNNVFDALGYNAYRTAFINRIDPASFGTTLRYRF